MIAWFIALCSQSRARLVESLWIVAGWLITGSNRHHLTSLHLINHHLPHLTHLTHLTHLRRPHQTG